MAAGIEYRVYACLTLISSTIQLAKHTYGDAANTHNVTENNFMISINTFL
jgi:hypothetical protein